MSRRLCLFMGTASSALALLFSCPDRLTASSAVEVPDTVSGKVFLDANNNGKMDPGEAGLAGVAITDGVTFATTGEDGRYTIKIGDEPLLPHKATHTVAVCWPSEKWPSGKWWVRLDQLEDPKNVNFGLREDRQDRPIAFAQVTDNHGGKGGAICRRVAKDLEGMGPTLKFMVNTGDLFYANYSHPPEANKCYQDYMSDMDDLPLPLFHVPGNHDMCGTNKNDADKKASRLLQWGVHEASWADPLVVRLRRRAFRGH